MTSRQRATAAWREAEARLKLVRGMWREARAQGPEAVRLLREGRTATRHLPAVETLESEDAAFANERALHAAAPAGYFARLREKSRTDKAAVQDKAVRLRAVARGPAATTAARAERRRATIELPDAEAQAAAALTVAERDRQTRKETAAKKRAAATAAADEATAAVAAAEREHAAAQDKLADFDEDPTTAAARRERRAAERDATRASKDLEAARSRTVHQSNFMEPSERYPTH